MEWIATRAARRLALARAGLLKPAWTAPSPGPVPVSRRFAAAHGVIRRFGYLQLDTVAVAGARSHSIVLMSRLPHFRAEEAEALLRHGEPLFEYWGHEASWLPIELYPVFGWRRKRNRLHPWWGDILGAHRAMADDMLRRIRDEGPLRAGDFEGRSEGGWWNHKPAKRVAVALWSAGDLAIRERRGFQRTFDLPERVIAARWREAPEPALGDALKSLLRKALDGHGWATSSTLAQTFRLRRLQPEVRRAVAELAEAGEIVACGLKSENGDRLATGWIRPADVELASRLSRVRPSVEAPVLLSPFDPLLWDRRRLSQLFDFNMTVEIFKPPATREFGYYCLPVLAGESLVARVDLKADRARGVLRALSLHPEPPAVAGLPRAETRALSLRAVRRFARQVGLRFSPGRP
ncbi:MAG: YcaQ family DNA glycosylase [Planctomycetes bacterium]|nr:YcaQ family DNA glycosylase [Planctomycetota bacterium]